MSASEDTGPGSQPEGRSVGSGAYEAEIRRTTHGVAHIRGESLPDVAFGQAYAIAAVSLIFGVVPKSAGICQAVEPR